MIEYEKMWQAIVKGLSSYLSIPVIPSNQNAAPPGYPYISYTVTSPVSANKGTYSEHEDGTASKQFTQTASFTALSDNELESVQFATMARAYFDYAGTVFLNDNDVVVQSVGGVTNRDNFLTVEYEYKNGFDVFFALNDVIAIDYDAIGWIEEATINDTEFVQEPTEEELAEKLAKRLSGR
jgi:hypothetical protein